MKIKRTVMALSTITILGCFSAASAYSMNTVKPSDGTCNLNNSFYAKHDATGTSKRHVTAYLLLSGNTGSLKYLHDLVITSKPLDFDRLNLSFVKPIDLSTNDKYTNDNVDLVNSGLITAEQNKSNPNFDLKSDIDTLKSKGVNVYISIGGWAYSECNAPNYQSCTTGQTHFPLSPKVADSSINSVNQIPYYSDVQPTDKDFSKIINSWVKFANTYHFSGIDIDYEENWYASSYAIKHPLTNQAVSWATLSNGPLIMPQTVEKLGFILQDLESDIYTNNQKNYNKLSLTMAGISVGAYDIHTKVNHGNFYWNPHSVSAGNLKGIYYDLLNVRSHTSESDVEYKDFNRYSSSLFDNFPYLLENSTAANKYQLSGMHTIGVMSYDLDDGYDAIGSKWCIGDGTVRDPADKIGLDVDCSISSQTVNIMKMYQKIYKNNVNSKPSIYFGLEAGFPNYPINLDPSLAGGGKDHTDAHYRWNDPWIVYDTPMKSSTNLPSYKAQNDVHSNYLVVNHSARNNIFNQVGNQADGVIVWSLKNNFYDNFLSEITAKGDYNLYFNKDSGVSHFGKDYKNYGSNWTPLGSIFNNSASPKDILDQAQQYYLSRT